MKRRILSVSEYASMFKVSVQSVYQRVKRQTLKSEIKNGITYIILENEEIQPDLNDLNDKVENDCKDLLKLVKSQQKEIKRLTKALEQAKSEEVQTLKAFIGEMKQLTAPKTVEDDFIEVKTKKKKKKKKK